MRVELPIRLDLLEALLLQEIGERAMYEPNTVLELRLFMIRRRLERAAEIVEDRDQFLHKPLVRALGERRLLARVALAEVVELRSEPLQAIEELIAVSLESVDVEGSVARRGGRAAPPAPPPSPHPPEPSPRLLP